MNAVQSNSVVVAGALIEPAWLAQSPVDAVLATHPACAALVDAGLEPLDAPTGPAGFELAHDLWLRTHGPLGDVAPGALAGARRLDGIALDALPDGRFWLAEPVHLHLGRDHVVLLHGGTNDLAADEARALAAEVAGLFATEGLRCEVHAPGVWTLRPADGGALDLLAPCAEVAYGRNIDAYLPQGADRRRYRRLLNELQMTWFTSPVNAAREARRALPVNGIWLGGPLDRTTVARWRGVARDAGLAGNADDAGDAGAIAFDASLLAARFDDDPGRWLDALEDLARRLDARLAQPQPPDIVLCGETTARRLRPGRHGTRGWRGWFGLPAPARAAPGHWFFETALPAAGAAGATARANAS